MYREEKALVLKVTYENENIQHLITDRGAKRALLYKQLTKRATVGDYVIVNTTATALQLGTGGWDIVRYVLTEDEDVTLRGDGHIMKVRYTPVQHSVLAVEEKDSPYHDTFKRRFSLRHRHVLLAELHSMVPLIFYIAVQMKKDVRCCVIFDDQASLALAMSRHLNELHKNPSFTSVTVGQAFGGQFEAVTVASALQFAEQIVQPDLIAISVGPGVVGTGTVYGFSGMAMANWSHTVSALDGVPVWIPRLSFAEKRERHYGLSHHTLTPLSQFTFKKAILPFPYLNKEQLRRIKDQLKSVPFQTEHDFRFATTNDVATFVEQALKSAPFPIETMGRGFHEDPVFFFAVAEAVRIALMERSL